MRSHSGATYTSHILPTPPSTVPTATLTPGESMGPGLDSDGFTSKKTADDNSAHPKEEQQHSLQVFPDAQDFSIGSVTTTYVGRDSIQVVHVHATPLDRDADVPLSEIPRWLQGPDFLKIFQTSLAQRTPNTGVWFIRSKEFCDFVQGDRVIVWHQRKNGSKAI